MATLTKNSLGPKFSKRQVQQKIVPRRSVIKFYYGCGGDWGGPDFIIGSISANYIGNV
jgi:hypothetical protein